MSSSFFFFFQAEDGIRDYKVTGVQTCALPISYQNWEVVDPEKWVPDGYVCVRVDSRGAGRSPGFLDVWSHREAVDLCACIEWAASQPWSTGKIGLNGISYRAMNQWQAAALRPPHLAAMCVWEGAADYYRDLARHGGILCAFGRAWYPSQVVRVQHGVGARGYRSRMTGEWVSGPETLPEEQLGSLRSDFYEDCLRNTLASDEYWRSRLPDFSKIKAPLFSPPTGGARDCIRAATSRASCAPARARSGSRCTVSSTGPISIPTTASACRSGSSRTSSRVRTAAGGTSRRCSSRSAGRAGGSRGGGSAAGRARAR